MDNNQQYKKDLEKSLGEAVKGIKGMLEFSKNSLNFQKEGLNKEHAKAYAKALSELNVEEKISEAETKLNELVNQFKGL